MPRGKKKFPHPPLTFLNSPFSKPLGSTVQVTSSEVHPEVKIASVDDGCTWIDPDFKITGRYIIPKKDLGSHIARAPILKVALDFVNNPEEGIPSRCCEATRVKRCPLFPLVSPERNYTEEHLLVEETPECQL
ncbi:hypothetical protein PHET_03290 [Paragonimus heterotremus]|uniref:Uncharacterized protein n=1 Tax=Paragonimus heterotremus TaxID=100268 RepID=A0A8J4WSE3_9TREM|nr:hypothetical protein PHET_03290 [Paragonimus heterotremus]